MNTFVLAVAALVVSVVTGGFAIATFIRAGRWKEGAEAKELVAKVDGIDRRLAVTERTPTGLGRLTDRVTTLETQVKGLATKADIAGIGGTLAGIKDLVIRAENAVERVERILMEKT